MPARTKALTLAALLSATSLIAQVPDSPAPFSPPPAAPAPNAPVGQATAPGAGNGQKPANSPFGQEVPVFDPGTEVLTFNGKNWNVTNQRVFQARFEKYLNEPEATSQEDLQYKNIIDRILWLLAPGNATQQNVDAAFKLLPYAGAFEVDGRLSNSLADAVYSVWQAQRNQARIGAANASLEEMRKQHEWNLRVVTEDKRIAPAPTPRNQGGGQNGNNNGQQGTVAAVASNQDFNTSPYLKRLAEAEAAIKANWVKRELSELQAKVEFQALMVQFLLQRRFQHVLMSTRFYRALFTDGDTKLNLSKDATELFQKTTGVPPTVSILDSMANELLTDVNKGVEVFSFLLSKGELHGATMRLQEVFIVGEFMPSVRMLQRERKRQCLEYAQKSYQLISSIDVRDYTRAETLIKDLKRIASDFDDSKPTAAVEAARIRARGELAKAKKAALDNNQADLEKALLAAGEIWPGNPEFKEVFDQLNKQGDVMQKALLEFDQLVSQRNIRQIWNDKIRFIAAVALNPERKPSLEKVLKDMETIEGALLRSEEMARQGNYAGAWEGLERTFAQYPDDAKLNQQRADMTTRASNFVQLIREAETLEKRQQTGASLSHYLKAQKLYPASDFARDGVARLVPEVLPGASMKL